MKNYFYLQDIIVSGKVEDGEINEFAQGVIVIVKRTAKGTISNNL